ncbi:hypothetical protein TWF696_007923 [Orbilia brochopaga]|uniref:F-box domain-containing protein n=1 Tax=Orbilia brochopaga TaxID=3140254 RepID=A0AAV9UQC2_9PEZI
MLRWRPPPRHRRRADRDTMTLTDFPSELIVEVFSHLDVYSDVRRLCLVCRRFRDIGMPMLYRTVILRGHHRDGIHWRELQAFFQIDNPWMKCIQYLGVEAYSCGLPALQDQQKGFSGMIDTVILRFLQNLRKDQLKGMIVCDGMLVGEEVVRYINENQRGIRSFYESDGVRTIYTRMKGNPPMRKHKIGIVSRFLRGRTGLTDIALSKLPGDDIIPFYRVLADNAATVRTLELDLTAFRAQGIMMDMTVQAIKNYGGDVDNPTKLTALRKLAVYKAPVYPDQLASCFASRMVDYSQLTYLKLYHCYGEGLEFWKTFPRYALQLRHFLLVDKRALDVEVVSKMLLSFRGLVDLVLEFPHEPAKVRAGVLNHADTLEKLYWRPVVSMDWPVQDEDGNMVMPGKFLTGAELDFRGFPRLAELGACISETGLPKLKAPPQLRLLYILHTDIWPKDLLCFPTKAEISRISRIVLPDASSAKQIPPFKYLVMGYRKHAREWPLVLELQLPPREPIHCQSVYISDQQYAYREVGDREMVRSHPRLRFPMEMENWAPWDASGFWSAADPGMVCSRGQLDGGLVSLLRQQGLDSLIRCDTYGCRCGERSRQAFGNPYMNAFLDWRMRMGL